MGTATDHAGLVVLDFDECLDYVTDTTVGRVAFYAAGEVEVLPVNYTMDGSSVAFRTLVGSKLSAALQNSSVTFEVDGYDDEMATGWSVVFKGQAEVISDPETLKRLEGKGLQPFVTSVPRPVWVLIRANSVTGRRVPDGH